MKCVDTGAQMKRDKVRITHVQLTRFYSILHLCNAVVINIVHALFIYDIV
jgi:hypothetical protein